MNVLKMWFCLFTFRPIALKQLNNWTTMNTWSWPGGQDVTHPHLVLEVPGSITRYGNAFYV